MTSLIAPITVQQGVPFQLTASTFGSTSCTHPNGYRLEASAARIEVRLYDISAPPNSICTADLRRFPRELTVQFDQAGIARIVIVGRADGGGELREISQTVSVEP